jgi:Tfp pilus assembly protein PilO
MSKKIDLRNLDTSNPGSWPFPIKIAACVFVGLFIIGVASLPRVVIMTMHNISLTPRAGKPGLLVLQGTIKTYRYLDDEEVAAQQAAPAAGGSK